MAITLTDLDQSLTTAVAGFTQHIEHSRQMFLSIIGHDLRKSNPYIGYETYDFAVPTRTEGDCYARYVVRLDEMRERVTAADRVVEEFRERHGDVIAGHASRTSRTDVTSGRFTTSGRCLPATHRVPPEPCGRCRGHRRR